MNLSNLLVYLEVLGIRRGDGSEGVTDHTLLTNIGVNTHAQIDTALTRLADTSGTNTGDQDLSGYQTTSGIAAVVRATVLTGLSTATNAVVTATNTMLEAVGLLQKQVSDNTTSISGKQATLVSGTSIKTINSTSILGSGNLSVTTSPGGASGQVQYNDGAGAFAAANFYREDANTLAQRNGTTPQVSYTYNTYTDASNYERQFGKWVSNEYRIGVENTGTGSVRSLGLYISSTRIVNFAFGGTEWTQGGPHYFKGANHYGVRAQMQAKTADWTTSLDDLMGTYTNGGASGEVIGTLSNSAGDQYSFAVVAAQYLRVKVPTGVVIYDGVTASASAGYIRSNAVGSTLSVRRVASNVYVVVAKTGTWTIDS